MYHYDEIKRLHLEITSSCNASCPQCGRNVLGGKLNPHLPVTELGIDDARRIFTPEFIKQLNLIYLCGNYGDPMVARDTLEILEYFRECNPAITLGMYTNGSGRNPEWWARLARVVTYCRFSIDGLEDTNHLYRRGTHWNRIMESVTAFIAAGGRAEWDYVVFRHNEHQVENARALSRKLGFAKFFAKRTYRFINPKTGQNSESSPVQDRDGNLEYMLEGPVSAEYQHQSLVQLSRVAWDETSYRSFLNQTGVTCKVALDKKLYLSAEGLVFPCCWTANIYHWLQPREKNQVWELIHQLPEGKNSINALRHSLKEIVEGPFFQQLMPDSWQRRSLMEGKLEVCARVCGDFDLGSTEYMHANVNLKRRYT